MPWKVAIRPLGQAFEDPSTLVDPADLVIRSVRCRGSVGDWKIEGVVVDPFLGFFSGRVNRRPGLTTSLVQPVVTGRLKPATTGRLKTGHS